MPISVRSPEPGLAAPLRALVRAALASQRCRAGELGVVLTDDAEVRALNRRWRRLDSHTCVSWRESGGPPVRPPTRHGFGSRLIARATQQLQPADLSYAAGGLCCEFTVRGRGAS